MKSTANGYCTQGREILPTELFVGADVRVGSGSLPYGSVNS